MSIYAREEEPLAGIPGGVEEDLDAPGACGLGICAAEEGHPGTCEEASGWDVDWDQRPITELIEAPTPRADLRITMSPTQLTDWRNWAVRYRNQWTTTTTWTTNTATSYSWSVHNTVPYVQTGDWHTVAMPQSYNVIWDNWSVRDQLIPEVNDEVRRLREERNAEQRRLRIEARDRAQAQAEARSRRALAARPLLEKARERAEELLDLVLSPAEKIYRDTHDGKILVTGGDTGNLYLVDTRYHGVHGNIRQSDEHGCELAVLCVAPEMSHRDEHGDHYGMPLADGFVGQVLSLKHNEQELLAKANFSRRRQCAHQGVPILRAS